MLFVKFYIIFKYFCIFWISNLYSFPKIWSIRTAKNFTRSITIWYFFILQRPRPIEFKIINETGYSFPSGHSMISMAFYGYIIYLIYNNIKNKYLKTALISILSLLIVMIGISRIYLGVHYTSDVCAGFLVSISYLIIYINFANKIIMNKEKKEEKEWHTLKL